MENKMISRFLLMACLLFTGVCQADVFQIQDKLYVDTESFSTNTKGDEFYIHTGNNVWLVTHTINRDSTGMYVFEHNIKKSRSGPHCEKMWKCPYCYNYWPIGKPCGNPSCPSKYK